MSGNGTRRQWGWHPLRPDWARILVSDSPVRPGDLVVDLGAGTGAVTGPLLDAGARVIAVELHPGRADALRERYGAGVVVVRADLRELRLPRRPFRVVASPPYQLSSALVAALLGTDRLLSADLVLQRATARRLAAAPAPRPARQEVSPRGRQARPDGPPSRRLRAWTRRCCGSGADDVVAQGDELGRGPRGATPRASRRYAARRSGRPAGDLVQTAQDGAEVRRRRCGLLEPAATGEA